MAASSGGRREIPDDFKYNVKKSKHLKHILHNVSVALGTLTSAFNEFGRFKGPDISPDGRLGGVGYILPLKDIKQSIQTSVYALSDIADCIADELTNPRWSTSDDKEVKELIKEKDKAVEKVEEDIVPEDVSTSKPEEDTTEETPDKEEVPEKEVAPENIDKMASDKNTVLASAVQESLKNFFGNNK
jgi:hypothetical protein